LFRFVKYFIATVTRKVRVMAQMLVERANLWN